MIKRKTYNQAVRELSDKLYRFALYHTKNIVESEDIVQECFLKLWENRKNVDDQKYTKWLFVTAHHMIINNAKKQQVRDNHHSQLPPVEALTMLQFEDQDIIFKCLEELPKIQRSVILLRDLEGYNYQEIGEITQLNEPQVKSYIFRGRKKFRDAYHRLVTSKIEKI